VTIKFARHQDIGFYKPQEMQDAKKIRHVAAKKKIIKGMETRKNKIPR
jgi:hypothetical protein